MKALTLEIARWFLWSASRSRLLLFGQHEGRPGVRHIGHDLNALIADGGEARHGLGEGEIQIGVSAKG